MSDQFLNLNKDAFSDGQMRSKIWLSKKLGELFQTKLWPRVIIFGSWYGLLPFVLKLREDFNFKKLILCDIDEESLKESVKILNHFVCQGLEVETICVDCNQFPIELNQEDFVMNTSCEHINSIEWWLNLPKNTHFVLQSTNMKHPTHIRTAESLTAWKKDLAPIQNILYEGQLHFSYPDKEFDRFMLIGQK